MINYDDTPSEEPSEIEKQLGFRVRSGMVWSELHKMWCVPRIDHMQKAVEIIQRLIDKQKEEP